MICARAELAALLMKAARGAGLPLALAEDLYQMADFVTAEDVSRLTDEIEAGGASLIALTHDLDAVACGVAMASNDPLAPALAAAQGWVLADGRKADGLPNKRAGALDIPDDVLHRLNALAARTYVPETAASRARGAGAGAIDND